MSFLRRISHCIQPTRRRFGVGNNNNSRTLNATMRNTSHGNSTPRTTRTTATPVTRSLHTSASSTTSSVRRATQEATRAAAAATGPPTLPSFLLQHNSNSSRNSIISADSASFWNEFLGNHTLEGEHTPSTAATTAGGNSFFRYLRIPLRAQQQEINATTPGTTTTPPAPPQSSASSTTTSTTTTTTNTTRRMHILVIEYRPNSNETTTPPPPSPPLPPVPSYRFLGLRRPRSEVSTTSSTDTIQSMPLSMNSNSRNSTFTMNRTQPQQQSATTDFNGGGQWVVYVVNGSHAFQALSSSIIEENPSYEDLLWLSNMLGTVRPSTTTQAAVDEAIPVIDWSDETKNEFKDESCLVCLDEFALKQPVRVLKCHHVFHRECVDRWLCEAHNSCPVCRGVPVESSS
ncbi:unnamed protein product [Mucor hiemalis]